MMIRSFLLLTFSVAMASGTSVHAGGNWFGYDRGSHWHNAHGSWQGPQYSAHGGRPMAVIVPPTARFQTNYSWGVGRSRMTPIQHQFARPYIDPATGTVVAPTPRWPSDTTQFGFYYVRGPW